MKLQWTSHFPRAYGKAPKGIQAAFDKQSFSRRRLPRQRGGKLLGPAEPRTNGVTT